MMGRGKKGKEKTKKAGNNGDEDEGGFMSIERRESLVAIGRTGEDEVPWTRTLLSGRGLLKSPYYNKGQAFSIKERRQLHLHGLMPEAVESVEKQIRREVMNLNQKPNNIEKYAYLMGLLDRNERLFHQLLITHITMCMPLVYTPTVGEACQKYSYIWTQPRGLYISIADKGNIYTVLKNWPIDTVKAIVFTDGERILGLGDLGVNGMGIPVGKLQLYSACAGIKPRACLPVQLDVGTDTVAYHQDEFYMGRKHKRVRGEEYYSFVEEFMLAAQRRFGRNVILQFEDFGNSTAFHLLERTKDRFTTFNDDIQGTASVTLAGVISSLRITSKIKGEAKKLADHRYLFLGAGEAGTGIANLIAYAIHLEAGISVEKAREKIWLVDSKGLVTKQRHDAKPLDHHKIPFAHDAVKAFGKDCMDITNLELAIELYEPTCLIGVTARPGMFTERALSYMTTYVEKPLVFALSNPTDKAECTAEQAYEFTKGKAIFATGSPFDPYEFTDPITKKKRTIVTGQGNNAYIFPGLALGVLSCEACRIPNELLYAAAQSLAVQVSDEQLEAGSLYPPLPEIREVSRLIAINVAKRCYELNIATHLPQPQDIVTLVDNNIHYPAYKNMAIDDDDF